MTLSSSQRAAVTRTGQDVCVVAGPGSGKTRVLVERFAWLISECGVSPLRILAITFTEKAATEIKRRLAAGFSQHAALREQVERAYVSTVHGFCARLLREYPIQAGLDPGFLILDDAESARLLDEAAHRALEELYQERRSEMRRLLGALNVAVREGARQPDIAEALTGIYQELRTAGRALDELRAATERPAGGLTLAGFVAELRSLIAAAPARRTAKQAECLDALLEWAARASAMAERPVSEDHFQLLEGYPREVPRGNGYDGHAALKNDRRKLVESWLAEQYFRPLKDLLLDALDRIDARYREAKAAAGGLDFSDLEERAIALLEGDARIHDQVRGGFDHILMDELQDTNPLQWRLVRLLRRPNGFFAVGDVNQSIYGFRYASPDAFEAYRSEVEAAGGVIDRLYENYRSRPEILAAAERVLEGAPGLDPRTLEARRQFHPVGEEPVEVIAGPLLEKGAAARAEARGVARRIAALAGRLLVEDGEGGRRPLRFRDVASWSGRPTRCRPLRRLCERPVCRTSPKVARPSLRRARRATWPCWCGPWRTPATSRPWPGLCVRR
jgi:superfamily I DNA/RNA helicase